MVRANERMRHSFRHPEGRNHPAFTVLEDSVSRHGKDFSLPKWSYKIIRSVLLWRWRLTYSTRTFPRSECSLMPGSILFSTEVSMYDTEKAFYRHYEYIQKENSLYSRWFQKRGLSYPQFLILDAVLQASRERNQRRWPRNVSCPSKPSRASSISLSGRDSSAGNAARRTGGGRGFLSACGRRFRDRHYGRAGSSRTGCAHASISAEDMETFNNVYAAIVDGLEKHLFSDPS